MITAEKIEQLKKTAGNISRNIIHTGYLAGKGGAHFGGSLSMSEFLAVLYSDFVTYDPNDLLNRDRVILSKGHAALAMYCALYEKSLISKDDLDSFEKNGSEFVAHSKRNLQKGIEFSGGSLGLGCSYGVGVAYSCKLKGLTNKVYLILGDGELNEGLVWESLMFAAHKKLNNLVVYIDHNHLQADGAIEEVMDTAPLKDKLKSFGYDVLEANGHSVEELYDALASVRGDKPTAIIGESVKGHGVSFMENKAKWHHGSLNETRYHKALKELGGE